MRETITVQKQVEQRICICDMCGHGQTIPTWTIASRPKGWYAMAKEGDPEVGSEKIWDLCSLDCVETLAHHLQPVVAP